MTTSKMAENEPEPVEIRSSKDLNRLLDVMEDDIVPLTEAGVASGCKLFGAAILRKSDLSVVVAATNSETENLMWHGEITCLNKYFELPRETRPPQSELIFFTTHEPCSLCLSGITWSGFDNFYYFFTYEDSRDSFAVPYDIDILQSVYQTGGSDTPLYNRHNKYFKSYPVKELIEKTGDEDLKSRIPKIQAVYDKLSDTYQAGKGNHGLHLP